MIVATRAAKMTQIARCDWLPERLRWSHLARSGLTAVSRKKNPLESHIILEQLVLSSGYLLIVGDFNIHVDDVGNSESANFLALIDSFDLKQMVSFSTHINGHSLDLVVVRNSEPLGPVENIETIDPALFDHLDVKFKIPITKQPFKRKMIKYRNFKSLDSQSLATSISESRICADIYTNYT